MPSGRWGSDAAYAGPLDLFGSRVLYFAPLDAGLVEQARTYFAANQVRTLSTFVSFAAIPAYYSPLF